MRLKWKSEKPVVMTRGWCYFYGFLQYCLGFIVGYLIGRG